MCMGPAAPRPSNRSGRSLAKCVVAALASLVSIALWFGLSTRTGTRGSTVFSVPPVFAQMPQVPIQLLGGETLIGDPNGQVAFVFKRESDCSLTAYFLDLGTLSASKVQTNYQDILHQQAKLKTTADAFPKGCAVSKLGIPSQYISSAEMPDGTLYGVIADGEAPFSIA